MVACVNVLLRPTESSELDLDKHNSGIGHVVRLSQIFFSFLPAAAEAKLSGKGDATTQGQNVLKMNFSVEVNIYNEKVTSYWYRLR
jgi:hypothetical protein